MRKKRQSLKSMTAQEQEKEKKRRFEEQEEKLNVLGQESDVKAAKWVIEEGEKDRKEEDEKEAVEQWKLHDARKKKFSYRDALKRTLIRKMQESDIPGGYKWSVAYTSKGLLLGIRSKRGKWFARGIKPSQIPRYDLNAIDRLVNNVLQFIDNLEQNVGADGFKRSPGGIILP